ncbi:hypothetical protein SCUCBS95973_002585 [Sporothrix curviconia]|uniref:Duf1941 family protein n=1 Tax=Sporothrix curviconia TaxID=1260050 RepID=A0ABP0B857_9PEZI
MASQADAAEAILVDGAESTQAPAQGPGRRAQQEAAIVRIEQLLRAKDDTSRFVALALLKAVLDNQVKEDGGNEENDEGQGDTKPADASAGSSSLPEEALLRLWEALPVKFFDKLLRAGLKSSPSASTQTTPKGGDAAHMRDLAVAVLHTFAVHILPDERKGDARLVGRIPLLVASLLNSGSSSSSSSSSSSAPPPPSSRSSSSPATPTTTLILQTLATLVSRAAGAAVFNTGVGDLSPLTELAPEQPLVLDILLYAWLHGLLADRATAMAVSATINKTLPALAAAFKDTDGVTLLDFVAKLLRNAEAFAEQQQMQHQQQQHNSPNINLLLPKANPAWMRPVGGFVRRLAASRPTAAARAAYTHAAAALLRVYPIEASALLWEDGANNTSSLEKKSSDTPPFAYLLVSLLLVDLRATLPGLLAQLNSPSYAATAGRLASAFDILSAFIGYLVRALEQAQPSVSLSLSLSPDNLLRLRKSMAETLSVAAEHLRDRWDAAVAGAQGLHPDARGGGGAAIFSSTLDAAGLPLAWDAAAAETVVDRDPLVLAAVHALALWLREDDNEVLRREAAGLVDMLLELYASSSEGEGSLDFRQPVLVALEGIAALEGNNVGGSAGEGDNDDVYERSATTLLLEHGAWKVLTKDLVAILQGSSSPPSDANAAASDAARGIEIVRVLLPIAEDERPGTREAWMDLVTLVAAWAGPDDVDDADDDDNDDNGHISPSQTAGVVAECRVAVLQLVTALVANAHPSLCRRYTHSISAVIGLARQMRPTLTAARIGGALSVSLVEALDDVQTTLESIRA